MLPSTSLASGKELHGSGAPVASSSAISCLHRHALESIFAFCSLFELAQLLPVCRDFHSAVRSMAPIAEKVWRNLSSAALTAAMGSPLARHIAELGEPGCMGLTLGPEQLALLADRASNLRHITCRPDLSAGAAFAETRWPARLDNLKVFVALPRRSHLGDAALVARVTERVNALLISLAQLTQLEHLVLMALPSSYFVPAAISFAPLAALTRLEYFYSNFPFTSAREVDASAGAAAHAEQLKALTSLRELQLFGEAAMRKLLLTPPHGWQFEELNLGWSDEVLHLLPTVPSLTQLRLYVPEEDATFLHGLPNLTHLELTLRSRPPLDTSAVLAALQHCTKLTTLVLLGGMQLHFGSDALAACLRHLPLLGSLRVDCTRFGSLSFLTALSRQLFDLELRSMGVGGQQLPPAELDPIKSLSALECLLLVGIRFEGATEAAVVDALRAALPKLESCEVR